jgi:hypothetical protein
MKRRTLLTLLLVGAPGRAQTVIGPGREGDVLALFAPHGLEREVVPGWKLWNVRIAAESIHVELVGPDGSSAELRLVKRAGGAESSASFDVLRDSRSRTGDARAAADALVAALVQNDPGGFWQTGAPEVGAAPSDSGYTGWPAAPVAVALAAIGAMWIAKHRAAGRSRAGPGSTTEQ